MSPGNNNKLKTIKTQIWPTLYSICVEGEEKAEKEAKQLKVNKARS